MKLNNNMKNEIKTDQSHEYPCYCVDCKHDRLMRPSRGLQNYHPTAGVEEVRLALNRKAEAAPAKVGSTPIMVTLNRGGSGEKTVKLSDVEIPDLWHIAQSEMDMDCRNAILTGLHISHDLKRTVEEQDDRNAALLTALKMFAFDYSPSPRNLAQYRDAARSAIALAEGGDR